MPRSTPPNAPPGSFNGPPGAVWTNRTDRVLWQYSCSFHNSCGQCAQYDGCIGPYWPIPQHPRCNCQQEPVAPGDAARPFTDFMEEVGAQTAAQQSRLVGAANWDLIKSGVVEWTDVVTRGGIRSLTEVIQRKKLTLENLTRAGIPARRAEAALERARPALAADAAKRAVLVELKALGLSDDQIKAELRARLRVRFNASFRADLQAVDRMPRFAEHGSAKTPPAPEPKPIPAAIWDWIVRRLGLRPGGE